MITLNGILKILESYNQHDDQRAYHKMIALDILGLESSEQDQQAPEKSDSLTKVKIVEIIEYWINDSERIHGKSESIDWKKLAAHKAASHLIDAQLRSEQRQEISDAEIEKAELELQKLNGWSYNERTRWIEGAKWYKEQIKKQ